MQTYHFKSEQLLSIDIEKAWNFFSSAKNLALITPPKMKFKIKTELGDAGIYEGMLIDYTVRPLFRIRKEILTTILENHGNNTP